MSEPNDYQKLFDDQQKEYGTYIATAPISINGVRAFNTGDAVPVGHVDTYDIADSVAKVGTKAANAATNLTPEG